MCQMLVFFVHLLVPGRPAPGCLLPVVPLAPLDPLAVFCACAGRVHELVADLLLHDHLNLARLALLAGLGRKGNLQKEKKILLLNKADSHIKLIFEICSFFKKNICFSRQCSFVCPCTLIPSLRTCKLKGLFLRHAFAFQNVCCPKFKISHLQFSGAHTGSSSLSKHLMLVSILVRLTRVRETSLPTQRTEL